MNSKFTVSIIGRPNVGKSKLFNRLTGHNISIVLSKSGTTRDRVKSEVKWLNKRFMLLDTGGISDLKLPFQEEINLQSNVAINNSNIILFVVSYTDKITPQDLKIFQTIKRIKNKKIFLIVNKSDNINTQYEQDVFKQFGLKRIFYVSAEHSIGIGDLLDEIIKELNITTPNQEIDYEFKLAIIGKTNVGKSTLVNSLINEERLITSKIPHTTREAIDIDFSYNKKKYLLIDTAGIRASSKYHKIEEEKYSVLRTKKAIARANCILLVLNADEPFTQQDEIIAGLIYKANIPAIIVVNKWDKLNEKSDKIRQQIIKTIKKHFLFINWAPIIFISALEKQKLSTIFDTLQLIKKELSSHFSTQILHDVLMKSQALNPIPKVKNQKIKLNYIVQVKGQIPTFVIFCNNPELLHFSYSRYIENQIRSAFNIQNIPLTFFYKSKTR